MRVTFWFYGKTPRTRTIRGAAPWRSWFAHSPAKPFAGRCAAGVGAVCVCVESGAGRESVRAHSVEDSRRHYQRCDRLDCTNTQRQCRLRGVLLVGGQRGQSVGGGNNGTVAMEAWSSKALCGAKPTDRHHTTDRR